ncbi:unnamed protein product [Tenebrio molitor]|nr:unnamed protein product [Tenebrio molitor]
MNIPVLKPKKQDVCTRWNSTFEMLSRILEIKDAVVSTLAIIDKEGINSLVPNEWNIVRIAMEILSIFNDVTIEVSAEKNVSISKKKENLKRHIQKHLNRKDLPQEIMQMLQLFMNELGDRFKNDDTNEIMAQATILDPRFKQLGFSNRSKYEAARTQLKSKICSILVPTLNLIEQNEDTPTPSASSSSLWAEFDQQVEKQKAVSNPTAAGIIKFDKYLNEPLIYRTQDPLMWWNQRKDVYPRLYELVKGRLCVLATSVPCERLFSKAGQTITSRRSRLSSSRTSQILFLNQHL